jgi:hypothetical protein
MKSVVSRLQLIYNDKMYFSNKTYKLPNFNHHNLFALDRSGHSVSHYFE